MTISLQERYAERAVSFHGVEPVGDWRVKVCGIAYNRKQPRRELIAAALDVARNVLAGLAVGDERYGAAFLGVHDGRGANFVYVDWWERENELHHRLYISPADAPTHLAPAGQADPIACVWDIELIAHERTAWIKHVLAREEGPDLDAYLADGLAGAF